MGRPTVRAVRHSQSKPIHAAMLLCSNNTFYPSSSPIEYLFEFEVSEFKVFL